VTVKSFRPKSKRWQDTAPGWNRAHPRQSLWSSADPPTEVATVPFVTLTLLPKVAQDNVSLLWKVEPFVVDVIVSALATEAPTVTRTTAAIAVQ